MEPRMTRNAAPQTIQWTNRLKESARNRPEYARPGCVSGKYVATSASAAPTSATPARKPWRAFETSGERNITSIPNPHSTISGAILYKSWMGGNIYFDFTENAALL